VRVTMPGLAMITRPFFHHLLSDQGTGHQPTLCASFCELCENTVNESIYKADIPRQYKKTVFHLTSVEKFIA
jgi:hypothetical protein